MPAVPDVAFEGLRARVLARLLEFGPVRYHRLQRGFVEAPEQYAAFLAQVVGPRLMSLPGRLGIFGVGAHTSLVVETLPHLIDRVHCFTDNNPVMWGQVRADRPVLPPADAVRECEAFFLSTAVFQRVLGADLRRLGFRGPVVAMDDVVPASWFLT